MEAHSTAGLPPRARPGFWQDVVRTTYVPVDLDIPRGTPFDAVLKVKPLGGITLSRVGTTPVAYRRTRGSIARSRDDDYLIGVVTSGTTRIEQAGNGTVLQEGDLWLFDTGRPYDMVCDTYSAIHVKLPRREFDRRVPAAPGLCGRRIAAAGCYAQLARSLIRQTFDTVSGPDVPTQLPEALLDLLAMAFDAEFRDHPSPDSRYLRIVEASKDVVLGNLGDAGFDLSVIPGQIGVSARTLNRAWAQAGTTMSRWMWQMRLDAARRRLSAPGGQGISEIALECGFNDLSHFSRAFRSRFGESPSAVKARR